MNIQDLLAADMDKLRRLNQGGSRAFNIEGITAKDEKLESAKFWNFPFPQYKDGKGDYSVDRQ